MFYLHDIIYMALLQSSLVLKHKNNQVMSQIKFLHEGFSTANSKNAVANLRIVTTGKS